MSDARALAAAVVDPELPMLTLDDLGVLGAVAVEPSGRVVVELTPTYSGCPALASMRADLVAVLRAGGYDDVEVRTVLDPPWTSDRITAAGRRKLVDAGIAPPGPAPRRPTGPVPLTLVPVAASPRCPLCATTDTEQLAAFSGTPCKALWRCRGCREPFELVKAV